MPSKLRTGRPLWFDINAKGQSRYVVSKASRTKDLINQLNRTKGSV